MRLIVLAAWAVMLCAPLAMAQDAAIERARAQCRGSGVSEQILAACDAAIASGRISGDELADAYIRRASILPDLGRAPAAIEDADRALAIRPNDALAYFHRGYAQIKLGRFAEAVADYDRSIAGDAKSPWTYDWRGQAKLALKDWAGALADFNATLQSEKDFADGYYHRGQVFLGQGEFYLAVADFERAADLNPVLAQTIRGETPYAAAYAGRCQARAQSPEPTAELYRLALADCAAALKARPGLASALNARGLVHLRTGQAKPALADFTAALKGEPASATALYGRGLAKRRLGDRPGAKADIDAAQKLQPDIAASYRNWGVEGN